MWLFTTTGFISAVNKDGGLVVRARDRQSLEPLAELTRTKIVHTPLADYPYRLITDKEQFTKWLTNQINVLDYQNFKSEIAHTRGYEFAHPLNKVWSVMHDVEDENARKR